MSSNDEMGFSVERVDGDHEVVVMATGELDIHSCPVLEQAVSGETAQRRVVLDLSGVTFIDSAGLRTILLSQQSIAEAGGEQVVRAPSPAAARLFQITGLDDILVIER